MSRSIVLAVPGRGDVRELPLAERWELLGLVLAGVGPPVERIVATTAWTRALAWYRDMPAVGVEGIVSKRLSSRYDVRGPAEAWLKTRHADTTDAAVVGIIGPERRPRAVVVELADGRRAVTSPRLDTVNAGQVADAVAGRLGETYTDTEHGPVQPVAEPLRAEIRIESGRHGAVRFVRLRETLTG